MGSGTPLSVEGAIPPLPPVEPQKPRRRRRAWIGAAIAVFMALIVGIVAVSRDGDHETPSGQAATWDPRVQDLVGFVEETRGLTFDHPVPIEFLSEDAFDAEVTSENADLTEEERRSLEGTEASFRALGLIGPHVDLLEALNTLSSGDVAAFYDSEREKVFAPEGEMTPALRATLVHELTHALQDQRFGLDRLQDDDGSDQNSAFRALVEGDAQRIQQAYVAAMSPEDAAAYQEEQKKDNASVTGALKGVPTVLRSLFESSYILGDSFTQVLLADGGQSRIDVAFGQPPTDEAQLLDPLTFLAGENATDVPRPPLPAGESEIDSGDFGAISWYLLLATRLDPRTALAAVDGWGGDSYVVFDTGSGTCIQAAFEGDNVGTAIRMERALIGWMDSAPAGSNDVRREDAIVTLRSCDEGSSVGDTNLPAQALLLPYVRTLLEAEVLKADGTTAAASCASNLIIKELSGKSVRAMTEGGPTEGVRGEIGKLAPASVQTCLASAPG